MESTEFEIGSIVEMRKEHPCGSKLWLIVNKGSDIRLKCEGCGRYVLIPRIKLCKLAKKINR